eukprot:TRINITY_DN2536_c0_g1_i1.p1 TRINITY_DN2536_c0_g1~~TRINITY_DN2536_c0_g1_i1.p1  ORF type:complete len:165 (+),score=26.60 TRINITY_DN2536_c0_g1_i1:365-859(+)
MYLTIDKNGYNIQLGEDLNFHDNIDYFDFLDEIPTEEEEKEKKETEKEESETKVNWERFKTMLKNKEKYKGLPQLGSSKWEELSKLFEAENQPISDWIKKFKLSTLSCKWQREWCHKMAGVMTKKIVLPKPWKSSNFYHKIKDQTITRLSIHNIILHSIQMFNN